MGLYESVAALAARHKDEQVLLILHTSCVLETAYSLRRLKGLANVSVTVPNNVFYELQLLKGSSNARFAKNAEVILTELCANRALKYDTEQFFGGCSSFVDVADLHAGISVFGFYDHSAAEEFIKYSVSRRSGDVYVFSYDVFGFNADFDSLEPLAAFRGFRQSREPFLCKCIPVPCTEPASYDPVENKKLRIAAGDLFYNARYISGDSLKLIAGGIGGEAKVYSTPELPGKVIKCYTKVLPSKEKTDKLLELIRLGEKIKLPNIAMPEELVFDQTKRCIGFTMPEVNGRSLSSIFYSELWYTYDRHTVLRRLAQLLLELRLYRINVVDLSGNNVRVSEDNRVYIIDCDSFETCRYPGSGYTPPYGSPDLDKNRLDEKLREPHQNNFEFAVLLFQCLLGWENPLTQKNMGDESPEWGVMQFPYEYNSQTNAAAEKYKRWMALDEPVRIAFADEFHFRRRHSIGAWVRALGL